jgi:hypothetical protein
MIPLYSQKRPHKLTQLQQQHGLQRCRVVLSLLDRSKHAAPSVAVRGSYHLNDKQGTNGGSGVVSCITVPTKRNRTHETWFFYHQFTQPSCDRFQSRQGETSMTRARNVRATIHRGVSEMARMCECLSDPWFGRVVLCWTPWPAVGSSL